MIINDHFILTAQQCVVNTKPEELFVVAGAFQINTMDDNRAIYTARVSNFFNDMSARISRSIWVAFFYSLHYWNSKKVASYHCNHNTRENADAICVLYIAEQIEFGRYVQPMCLPDDETVFSEGSRCFIAGWGETFSNDQESSLHELDMPLLR